MLYGNRKEYHIRNSRTLELKRYAHIFLHNLGSTTVLFGEYSIAPSEQHTIATNNVLIDEDITIDFNGTDNHLYISVITVKDCNK